MKLFDVYPLYNINIVKGDGCKVWDENGTEYLDLYGGHAVISIGHAHPHYTAMISNQQTMQPARLVQIKFLAYQSHTTVKTNFLLELPI